MVVTAINSTQSLQIPSNLALMRVGARKWLGFLVVIWGLVAALFATLKVTCFTLTVSSDHSEYELTCF